MKNNIVLVGMPASGKSTLGVLLAKKLAMKFVDTDLLIQVQEGQNLQQIQERVGMDGFQSVECGVISTLDCDHSIIATGGSAIYCSHSMDHLRSIATVVGLNVPLAEVERRIGDLSERGVVMKSGMTLADLYAERQPLMEKHAEVLLDCAGKGHRELVNELETLMGSTAGA